MRRVVSGISLCTVLFAFCCVYAVAREGDEKLQLSRTIKVAWPSQLGLKLSYLPNYEGFWLEGKHKQTNFSVWVTRKKPNVIANSFSVNRTWQTNLNHLKTLGESTIDHGCSNKGDYVFRCERIATTLGKKNLAEALYWIGSDDVVVVRVTTKAAQIQAEEILAQFSIDKLKSHKQGDT